MTHRFALPVVCLLVLSVSAQADEKKENQAREEFDTLVGRFEEEGGTAQFATEFFDLANRHRTDPVAIDAYEWILRNRRMKPDAVRAIEMIEERHLASPHLGKACERIARIPSPKAEQLLAALMESSPNENVQARACLQLVSLLEQQARTVDELSQNPELRPRVEQYYGEHVVALDLKTVTGKLERVYELMLDSFGSISLEGEAMGQVARQALYRIRHLSVGCVAPEIKGEDVQGRPFKLSDFRGKVVVLSFWAHW